jgi:hypothetical protein
MTGHQKNGPPCVKSDGGVIHTPTKEICAKVRCPILYTYYSDLGHK